MRFDSTINSVHSPSTYSREWEPRSLVFYATSILCPTASGQLFSFHCVLLLCHPTLITHSLLWSVTAAGINPVRARQRDFFRIIPRNRRNSVPPALIPYKPSRLVARYFSREPRNARDGRWKIWKCGSRMRSRDERLNKRVRVRSVSIFERKILNRDRRILYYTHVWFWNCLNTFISSFFNFPVLDVVKRSMIKGILYKRIQENQFRLFLEV